MRGPTTEDLNEFINALQLSIKTKIDGFKHGLDGSLRIRLAGDSLKDSHIRRFADMLGCSFERSNRRMIIPNVKNIDWQKLTAFLFVTRLTKKNIEAISRVGSRHDFFLKQSTAAKSLTEIKSVKDAASLLFAAVEARKMTLRTLSEKTGLTQASLSKFKAGGDIRLSNLIKVARALGLCLKFEQM